MAHQLVIGAGEVGLALSEVLECDLIDVHTEADNDDEYDVLHIAYPYSSSFDEITDEYARLHNADLVVVHSTVPPGTCDRNGYVHSPVRGRHPHLAEGVRTFVKAFGGVGADRAADVFRDVGVFCSVHSSARTTEVAKLVELAQLGAAVRVQKEIELICRLHGVPFDAVYTDFGHQYNAGYREIGEERFVKQVLDLSEGPLGGHCVAQNTPMLESSFFDALVGPISPDGWTGHLK